MRVARLHLEDFRSYDRVDIELAPGATAFIGPNGAGKTNLLEAVHVLSRGDTPRTPDDTDLVRWGAGMARLSALAQRSGDASKVEALIFAPAPPERRRPRRYLVDGAAKRPDDALGRIVVVAFFPEDVGLLTQAPSARRRYLDGMISQTDAAHRASSREYRRVLEQRNALLRRLRDEGRTSSEELVFWDGELARLAAEISLKRLAAVRELRGPFREAMAGWSGQHDVDIAYASPIEGDTAADRRTAYARAIAEKREKELWQGASLVGPHREDFAVSARGRDLASFASRGELRSVVLALKLAEAAWLRERAGEQPVFLLDDVLSELDPERRQHLVDALPEGAQSLVTSALPAGLPPRLSGGARIVEVRPGLVG